MASKQSPPGTKATKLAGAMTDTELRDHLHTEIQRKSKLCANPTYECSQPRIDTFDYCARHVLREPRGIFRQCTFIYPNGKKCPNAVPKYDTKKDPSLTTLCFQHSRLTQLRKTHCVVGKLRHVEDNVTLINSVAHYVKVESPPKPSPSCGQEEEIDVVSPQVVPFLPYEQLNSFEDAIAKRRKRRRLLDYASDSSSDRESLTITTTARDYGHIESTEEYDSEPCPLDNANAYSREEVVRMSKEKLMELQNLYFTQLDMLHHKLRHERRRYLIAVRREREVCCSLREQAKKSAIDKKHYKQLKALSSFHRRHGLDAIFYKKYKEKRTRAVESYAQKIPGFSRCIFTEGGVKCCERVLPCSRYCRKHILEDKKQCLFRACSVEKGGVICQEPIPGILDEATCVLHIPIPVHRQYAQRKYGSETEEEEEPEIKKIKQEVKVEWSPPVSAVEEKNLKVKVIKLEQFPLRENLESGMTNKRFDDEAPCCSKTLVQRSRRETLRQDVKNTTTEAPDSLNTTTAHIEAPSISRAVPATVTTATTTSSTKSTTPSKAGSSPRPFASFKMAHRSPPVFLSREEIREIASDPDTKVLTVSTIDGSLLPPYPRKYTKMKAASDALLAASAPKPLYTTYSTTAAAALIAANATRAATITAVTATQSPGVVPDASGGTTSRAPSTSAVGTTVVSSAPKLLPTLSAAEALMAANAPRSVTGAMSRAGATSRAGTTSRRASTSAKTVASIKAPLMAANTPRPASTSRSGTPSRAATGTATTRVTASNDSKVVSTMTAAEALLAANPPKNSRGRTASRAVTITALPTGFATSPTSKCATTMTAPATLVVANTPKAGTTSRSSFTSRGVTITSITTSSTTSNTTPVATTMTAAEALLAANPPKGVPTLRASITSRAGTVSTFDLPSTSNAQKVSPNPSAAEALMAAHRSRSMSTSRATLSAKTAASLAPPRGQPPITSQAAAVTMIAGNRPRSLSYSRASIRLMAAPISTPAAGLAPPSPQKSVISPPAPAPSAPKSLNTPSAAEALMAANRPRSLSYSRGGISTRVVPVASLTGSSVHGAVTISPVTQALMAANRPRSRSSSRTSTLRASTGAPPSRAVPPRAATTSKAGSFVSAAAALLLRSNASNTSSPTAMTISVKSATAPGSTTTHAEKPIATLPSATEALIAESRPRSRSSSRVSASSKASRAATNSRAATPKAPAPTRASTPRVAISRAATPSRAVATSTADSTSSSTNAPKVVAMSLVDNAPKTATLTASPTGNASTATAGVAAVDSTPTTTVVPTATPTTSTDAVTTAATRPAASTAGVTRRSHKQRS